MTNHDQNLLMQINEHVPGPIVAETPKFIPADAPFDDEQRVWLEGLFAGLHAIAAAAKAKSAPAAAGTALTILFGSQSGTCESLAKQLKKLAAAKGFDATIAELNSASPADLCNVKHLMVVAATFGEGDPTDNAQKFYAGLMSDDAAPLPSTLNFSVCGLGDSSYAHFNKVARTLDARLAELGATRAAPLVTCDVAYDDDFSGWQTSVFGSAAFASAAGAAQEVALEGPEEKFDKNHPFLGTLLTARRLSDEGSAKIVNHIEISLAGSEMEYEVGDALGVWPVNDMVEVEAILAASGFAGNEVVSLKSGPIKLRAALLKLLDLTTLTPKTAEAWNIASHTDLQVFDALNGGIDGLTPQALVDGLRPLQPRLYSISSSPNKHPGEVHLTVGEVHYQLHDRPRKGVASTYLGNRLQNGGTIGVYVQRSAHFHLPANNDAPVIMIGPGTGIAPFRSFLEEREIRGATGMNWLFFGDQHEATDYLYREEIANWQKSGLLTKLSLAWSRDSAEKVYVQHLIEKDGATFFEWLEAGAAIYVCGDASRMAADVDRAIRNIVARHGAGSAEAAAAYVENLKNSHRYQRDVY